MTVGTVAPRVGRDHERVSLDRISARRDQLDKAEDALDAIDQQRRALIAARDQRRAELHAEIVEGLTSGDRIGAVAAAARYSREQVRRIARARGIETA